MKILKFKKDKGNIYNVITNNGEYKLYDDIIIKYELLLKKDLTSKEWDKILEENNLLKAYYDALKSINIKMRCEKEISSILKKKGYNEKEIALTIDKLLKDKYINHSTYIEAYIHDRLSLYIEGEKKIEKDLINMGMTKSEIKPFLAKVDKSIYQEKISKYVMKKLKTNKKSANFFKNKIILELINKGFDKGDILLCLDNIEISENKEELEKVVAKLYQKYIKKYDLYTTKLKIKNNLYQKGYKDIERVLDKYE